MEYVVYGAGAVGGVIGAHLHRAGSTVTLVARGEHLSAVRRDGLRLDTAEGVLTVRAPATDTAADVAWTPETVVLLCVKSHQTLGALDDLVSAAPPGTPVVCVQNGVSNEREVLRRFASTYGVCVMLPCTHLEPGLVVQKCHPTPGILDIGRIPTGTDDTAARIAEDLRAAGFVSEPRPDVLAWKHRKLLMNLGNGVDAVCAPSAAAEELVLRAREEGEAVLAAAGIPVVSAEADRERRADNLQPRRDRQLDEGGSTWQSLTRGTQVEVDHLSGEIVLLARWHGSSAPVNELVQRVTNELARRGARARSVDAADLLAELS